MIQSLPLHLKKNNNDVEVILQNKLIFKENERWRKEGRKGKKRKGGEKRIDATRISHLCTRLKREKKIIPIECSMYKRRASRLGKTSWLT